MKKLSVDKLVETIRMRRKEKGLTQAQLADATGINRAMIGRIENKDYVPTVEQMQNLGETLGFEVVDIYRGYKGDKEDLNDPMSAAKYQSNLIWILRKRG